MSENAPEKPKKSTKEFGFAPENAQVLQCRACGRWLGWIGHARIVFCSDPICMATREWVWGNEDRSDLIVFLREQERLSFADIARILGVDQSYKVRGEYHNRVNRKLYARA